MIYDKEPIPQIGDISIILDWNGNPKCIIETIKVDKYKYKDVPNKFAEIEGEGDKSLDYWKKVHHKYFTEEANRIGTKFNDNSMQALETGVDMNASEVDRFYKQKPTSQPEDEGEIMVVQVDGKGVPMKRGEVGVKSAQLDKGEKPGTKKEAVVTAIYTI